ncbi:MAG: hypothetical protein K2J37_07775 [Ruminococcus sp.]|nr:hypothetical protein [Ruminococcus sp.]
MSVYGCNTGDYADIPDSPPEIKYNVKSCDISLEKKLLNIDRDTLLLGALIYLLVKDGGDMRLILALGYILL